MLEISNILRDARVLIHKYGWIQGSDSRGSDDVGAGETVTYAHRYCIWLKVCAGFSAYGATYRAAAIRAGGEEFGPRNFAEHAIGELCTTVGVRTRRQLEKWHDSRERTRREIDKLFADTIFRIEHGCPPLDERPIWDRVRAVSAA